MTDSPQCRARRSGGPRCRPAHGTGAGARAAPRGGGCADSQASARRAAILGVQAIRKLPVIRNDRIEVGWMMCLRLSCDHRIADGATSVQFLQAVRRDLENPLPMSSGAGKWRAAPG